AAVGGAGERAAVEALALAGRVAEVVAVAVLAGVDEAVAAGLAVRVAAAVGVVAVDLAVVVVVDLVAAVILRGRGAAGDDEREGGRPEEPEEAALHDSPQSGERPARSGSAPFEETRAGP